MAINKITSFRLLTTETWIQLPREHVFMQAGLDADGAVSIWFAINPLSETYSVKISMFGNVSLPWVGSYLGTVKDSGYIWHIFTDPSCGVTRGGEFHYVTKDQG